MTAIYRVLLEPVQAGRPQPYLTGDTFEGAESVNDPLVKLGILEFVKSLGISLNPPALDLSPFKPVDESEIKELLNSTEPASKPAVELDTPVVNLDQSVNETADLDVKKPAVESETDLKPDTEHKQRRRREVQP